MLCVAPETTKSQFKYCPPMGQVKSQNLEEVEKYIEEAKNKSELQRTIEWEKVPD